MRTLVLRGVLASACVTAGGLLYARIPRGSWPHRLPVWGALRTSPHHLLLGLALAFAGLVLLTWAWWDLRRAVRGRPDAIGRIRLVALAWAAPMLVAPPLFSGDGWSYVGTGYLAGHGLSPYRWTAVSLPPELRSAVSPRWLHTTSPYGPLPIAWGAGFAHLTASPWLLLMGYRLFALLAWAVVAWAVPRLARRTGRDPIDASVLALASPFVLVHGIGGLHNDLLVVALALAALAVTRRDRWLPGAVLAGCAAAVKVPGGLVVVGVVLLSLAPGSSFADRVRRSTAAGAVAALTLWVSGLVTGLGTGWVDGLSVPEVVHTPLAIPADLGSRVGHLLLGPLLGAGASHDLGLVLVLATAGRMLLFRRPSTDADRLLAVGVLLLGAMVLSPAVHPWYALWCVPLLAVVPLRAPGAAALTTGVLVLGLTAVGEPALHLGWLTWLSTWPVLLAAPVAWGLVWLRDRGRVAVPSR